MYASNLLYIVALFLSRASVISLEQRLSPERTHTVVTKGLLALAGTMMLASFLMIALGCNVAQPWLQVEKGCSTFVSRAYDCTTYTH